MTGRTKGSRRGPFATNGAPGAIAGIVRLGYKMDATQPPSGVSTGD
jgi:hypothetical protein